MEITGDFEKHAVCGVETIVWKWLKADCQKNEQKRRKLLKEQTDQKCLDVPMLDMRKIKNCLEFCDIVINTANLKTWQTSFQMFYGTDSVQIKDMSSGVKLIISKSGKHLATITLYSATNRLLIQSGDNQKKNFMKVLRDIPAIRDLRNC